MKPVLQALVLAERVYEDKSGKKIIAGTFNTFRVPAEPPSRQVALPDGTTGRFVAGGWDAGYTMAYISLTDVVGETDITLRMFNLTRDHSMFELTVSISTPDRLATVEVVAPLPVFRAFVTEPGTLSFDVLWRGEILGSHRLLVRGYEPPAGWGG